MGHDDGLDESNNDVIIVRDSSVLIPKSRAASVNEDEDGTTADPAALISDAIELRSSVAIEKYVIPNE